MNPTTTNPKTIEPDIDVRSQPPIGSERPTPLFAEDEARRFHTRWNEVQGTFVDEPQRAVESATALVSEVMDRLTESFARTRAELDQQWKKGDRVSTEDLRLALKRYRSFFDRLLTI